MNLLCYVLGHEYEITRKVTDDIRELKCQRCQYECGVNDETNTHKPLDKDLKNLHDRLIAISIKEKQLNLNQ